MAEEIDNAGTDAEKQVPKQITILDTDLIRRVDDERQRRGDATVTKTAAKLIEQRLAQIEYTRRNGRRPNVH